MKKTKLGWFHTGTDSFDNPEISFLTADRVPPNFGWGPFKTFKAAHADLLEMVEGDIRNLQDLHDNLHRMHFTERAKNEKNKTRRA